MYIIKVNLDLDHTCPILIHKIAINQRIFLSAQLQACWTGLKDLTNVIESFTGLQSPVFAFEPIKQASDM